MTMVLGVERGAVPYFRNVFLEPGDYLFGRDPGCTFSLPQMCVSRRHCRLRVTEDSAFVIDLKSRNGTFVNDSLVRGERQLAHGDRLRVGEYVFRVHLDPLPPAIDLATAMTDGPEACLIHPKDHPPGGSPETHPFPPMP